MAYDEQAPKTKQDSPHNVAAEAAILGAILFDNNAFHRVSELLIETDFYNQTRIFSIYIFFKQLIK